MSDYEYKYLYVYITFIKILFSKTLTVFNLTAQASFIAHYVSYKEDRIKFIQHEHLRH